MMDHPTTTAAALAIAALLAAVAARYYRRNRQLERQIEVLAAMRALNQVLDGRSKRPHVSIMRFNGVDYVSYKVRSVSLN